MINKPNLNLKIDTAYSFEELAAMELQNDYCYKEMLGQFAEMVNKLHLFVGDCPPKEGKGYVYLGDYILRYGKNLEPQVGFYRISDVPEWQALQSQLEEVKP